jgi:hypothetical protein
MTFAIIMGVYALILWVLLLWVWHKGYQEWKSNRANRVRNHDARVMDKRDASPGPFILFEYSGIQKEFMVPRDIFNELRIGQEGTLRLKGGKTFASFAPKSESERADDIYRRVVKD